MKMMMMMNQKMKMINTAMDKEAKKKINKKKMKINKINNKL